MLDQPCNGVSILHPCAGPGDEYFADEKNKLRGAK